MSTPHRLHLKATHNPRYKFRDLIDTLRARTALKEQIAAAHLPIHSNQALPAHSPLPPQPNLPDDILPVTQVNKSQPQQQSEEVLDLSEIEETISETEPETMREQEGERMLVGQITDLLRPEERMSLPKNEGRSGCIRRQRFTLNRPSPPKQPRYAKLPRQHPQPAPTDPLIAIKDVPELQMIEYWNTAPKITADTSMEEISSIFSGLIEAAGIGIANPTIKKYKNCVYMGALPAAAYDGIIYYFDRKLYYGQLAHGVKHGRGVEIDFARATRAAGYFEQGKKNGLFMVQKERENYEGILLHGLYHGRGKLMTEESVYTGMFENGKKHGFGEQFFPRTGLRLTGCFKDGEYQHLDHSRALLPDPTSEPQLQNKPEKVIAKNSSYDIDFQLQKTFKKQLQGIRSNEQPFSREDSKSLYDIVSNTAKANKYDFNVDHALSRLPKIHLEGIRTKFKEADPEAEQAQNHLRRELETPHRRYHSQQQKSFASSNAVSDLEEPLLRHRLNTPIHRLK